MTTNEFSSSLVNNPAKKINITYLQKTGMFLVLTALGLIVFLFGTSYFNQFDSNSSGIFKLLTSGIFLGLSIFTNRKEYFKRFTRVLYAFFVAASVNVVTW